MARTAFLLMVGLAILMAGTGCQKQSGERNDMPIKTNEGKGKSKVIEASLDDPPGK